MNRLAHRARNDRRLVIAEPLESRTLLVVANFNQTISGPLVVTLYNDVNGNGRRDVAEPTSKRAPIVVHRRLQPDIHTKTDRHGRFTYYGDYTSIDAQLGPGWRTSEPLRYDGFQDHIG